ncbi:MAG: amidohydrolase family protein, partial [Actinomycetota bacterium]
MSDESTTPFVIDGVIHAYNFLESNMVVKSEASAEFSHGVYKHHMMFSPEDQYFHLTPKEFIDDWAPDTLAHAVFAESPVDMAIYHAIPMFDFWKDGVSALSKGLAIKAKHPDRVLVYGTVNPLLMRDTLYEVDRQVKELGVDGIKLYPASYYGGKTIGWRMDDATFAFPLFERLLKLGIRNVAVHKAMPLGPAPLGPFKVDDVAGAAAAFPELNFQIVHGGYAFVEETALMLHKFPNIYVNLEATASYAMRRRCAAGSISCNRARFPP